MRTIRLQQLGQHGVTLVELLITIGLLSIMLVILATIFTGTLDIQNQNNSYNAVASDGRFVLARLDYDIARATAITTPASIGTTSSSLVMTVGGNTYTYALSGNNLQLTDNVGAATLNGNGTTVSALSFQRVGNAGGKDTIRYSFTLTSVARPTNGVASQTFTSTTERR